MTEQHNDIDASTESSLKGFWRKTLNSNGFIFTFLRSAVSSQCAGWVDMLVGFVLFAWAGLSPAFATALGAVCGGVVNCIINYRFTFHADGVDWRAVIVKYIIIWAASAALNSYGTEGFYYLMQDWSWLEDIGFKPDGYYAAARIFVAIAVSWFWNFPMQRYFVYAPRSFDRFAIALFSLFGTKKKQNNID